MNNQSINPRNKHIELRYHFIREAAFKKLIALSYCPTQDQLADSMKKPRRFILQERFRDEIGIEECAAIKAHVEGGLKSKTNDPPMSLR